MQRCFSKPYLESTWWAAALKLNCWLRKEGTKKPNTEMFKCTTSIYKTKQKAKTKMFTWEGSQMAKPKWYKSI